MPSRERTPDEFWAKFMPEPNTGCWIWLGARGINGYGTIMWRGRRDRIHRVALELTLGRPLARGEFACHRCDNPPCGNPAHLFLGTSQDNTADMVAKDRHARGERAGRARLTGTDVEAIRAACARGRLQYEVAAEYRITRNHVSAIVHGRFWKHLPVDPEERSRHFNAKVTAEQIEEIRDLLAGGVLKGEIALRFGISKHYIRQLLTRVRRWPPVAVAS